MSRSSMVWKWLLISTGTEKSKCLQTFRHKKKNVSYWEWIKEDLFFAGFDGLSVNKTNSNLKTQKLTCFFRTTSGLQPFFPISALPDGNRRQKLNTKWQRINRAISGGAIVKMGLLSNKSVDKWREWVKGKKGSGGGLLTVCCAD